MNTRVLIDGRKLGDGGIGVYIETLIDGLLELSSATLLKVFVTVLVEPKVLEVWNSAEDVRNTLTVSSDVLASLERWRGRVGFVVEQSGKYSLSEYFLMSFRQRMVLRSVDLYHSPHFTLPYGLPVPSVVTVHDLIHATHPERWYYPIITKSLVRSAVARAAHVIAVSEESARVIQEVTDVAPEKVTPVLNSVRIGLERLSSPQVLRLKSGESADSEFERLLQDSRGFLLFVGSDRAHKGFRELVLSYRRLRDDLQRERASTPAESSGSKSPLLAVVGNRYSTQTKLLCEELGLADDVRWLGDVNLSQLSALYSQARVAVVPSKVEGFGLVALEAMHCGCPVLCTDLPVFREVCGDAAWFADRSSAESLVSALRTILERPELSQEKVRLGIERAAQFTRIEMAEKTFRVYEKVLGRSAPELKRKTDQEIPPLWNAAQLVRG